MKKITIIITVVISLLMVLSTVIIKTNKKENVDTKIKYFEYIVVNGYSGTGVKYAINAEEEEIIAKEYNYSQETFEYEQIDNQIWDKQKWITFEKELYDSGLEGWKMKQEELDNKPDLKPTDGNTYKISITFNDNSKLELSAYCFAAFEIQDILNKYF